MCRSGILLSFPAEGVLVGAADPRVVHLHQDGAGLGLRKWEVPQTDVSRLLGHRGADPYHACTSAVHAIAGSGCSGLPHTFCATICNPRALISWRYALWTAASENKTGRGMSQ